MSTKDFDVNKLKNYYELGFNLPLTEKNQLNCWDYAWKKSDNKNIESYKKFWATTIEPFIKVPNGGLELNTHLADLINNVLGKETRVKEGQNTINCAEALNKAVKTEIKLDVVKKEAMKIFGIVEPAKPSVPLGFVTSSVTTFRNEKFINPGIFKVLNSKRPN